MNSITDGRSSPLREIGVILVRRKWQILITFLLVLAGVTVMTLRTPKQYEARMKILVKNDRAGIVVSASSNDQSLFPGEVSETQINTEIELLNNNDLLRQVAIASGLGRSDVKTGKSPAEDREIALENAATQLQHDLKISPARKADIIEVVYTSRDPRQAAAVLRQLASSYLEAHLRLHGTPGTHEFFLNQTAHYRAELKDAEAKLTDFSTRNDITLFVQQQEELVRRASESSSMLLAAEAAIRESTRNIADLRGQLALAKPRVTTQSRTESNFNSVERLGTMLVELENRRTQLLSKFQPEDRLVQEVSQEIANTQAGLEKAKKLTGSEQTTDVNPVRQSLELDLTRKQAELAGLEARRQTLLQQTTAYGVQLKKLGQSSTEYNDLIRGQKEAEENYLLYARKTEEARIADSLDKQKIANVAIAENPVEPHYPSKPNVPLNLELGTAFAAFLSLGIAFSAEYLMQPFPHVETDTRPSHRTGDWGSEVLGEHRRTGRSRGTDGPTGSRYNQALVTNSSGDASSQRGVCHGSCAKFDGKDAVQLFQSWQPNAAVTRKVVYHTHEEVSTTRIRS